METGDGRVVGWFGNIFSGYEFNGRPLLAASTHAVVVKEQFRKQSMGLIAQFFRQREPQLLMVTTSNELAAQVWTAMKMVRVPNPYDQVRYWVVNPGRFIGAGLRRQGVPVASAIGSAAGLLMRRPRVHEELQTKLIADFDDRFDSFWARLRAKPDRLHAVRTSDALAWHYHDAGLNNRRAIIVTEEGRQLIGYAILTRRDAPHIGLKRYQIADLQVLEDQPALVRSLVGGALRTTREHEVDVLESTGFSDFKRGVTESLGPRIRQSPSFPYFYKPNSSELAATLQSAAAWDPCPYDGDAAF